MTEMTHDRKKFFLVCLHAYHTAISLFVIYLRLAFHKVGGVQWEL